MRKLRAGALLLIAIISTTIIGCSGNTPTKVVEKFFGEIQKSNLQTDLLLTENAQSKIEETEGEFTQDTQKKLQDVMAKLTFKVNSEKIEGETATVNVTVNSMDLAEVYKNVMKDAVEYIFSTSLGGEEMSEEEEKAYFDKLFNQNLDKTIYNEKTGDISLEKIDGKWKIAEDNVLIALVLGIDLSAFENLQ